MSSIAYRVLSAARALRKDPAQLMVWLESLEEEARRAFDGAYVALMSPIAEDTWETNAIILSEDEESTVAKIEFPHPVELVGFRFFVRPLVFTPAFPLVQATPEDMLVSVELDKQDQLTAHQEDTTVQGGPVDFVTMPSLDMFVSNRLIGKKLLSPKPELRFKWRWRQGPDIFVDSDVSVSAAWRKL